MTRQRTTDTPTALDVIDLGAHPDWPLHLRRPVPIDWAGRTWPTPEHAFAAAHTTSTIAWDRIADPATSSEDAHRIGTGAVRRDDWPTARFTVLREIVAAMTADLVVRAALSATGDALLVAAGPDKLWGRHRDRGYKTPIGRNELGRIWMRQRAVDRGDDPDRWIRAAVMGHREHLIVEPDTREWVQAELSRLATKLTAEHGTEIAMSGWATGVGLWWADAAHRAGMALWAYLPYPEQTAGWRPEQIAEHQRLLALASRRVTVGGRPDKRFDHDRSALMLSDADVVVAVRDPRVTIGGTVAALRELAGRRRVITVDVVARSTTISAVDPVFA